MPPGWRLVKAVSGAARRARISSPEMGSKPAGRGEATGEAEAVRRRGVKERARVARCMLTKWTLVVGSGMLLIEGLKGLD